jgi:hypothetical protein
MKKLLLFIVALSLYACSSSYSPSEKMLAYKKNMTVEDAASVIQNNIWEIKGSHDICGSRGFWYDSSSDMTVYNDKISLLAHKRGRQLKKHSQAFSDVVVFEKQYYKYDFVFNKVITIDIYSDPLLLPVFPGCNKKDLSEKYLIIDLFIDKLNNLKFTVLESDFDKTMAALALLVPDVTVVLK